MQARTTLPLGYVLTARNQLSQALGNIRGMATELGIGDTDPRVHRLVEIAVLRFVNDVVINLDGDRDRRRDFWNAVKQAA